MRPEDIRIGNAGGQGPGSGGKCVRIRFTGDRIVRDIDSVDQKEETRIHPVRLEILLGLCGFFGSRFRGNLWFRFRTFLRGRLCLGLLRYRLGCFRGVHRFSSLRRSGTGHTGQRDYTDQ